MDRQKLKSLKHWTIIIQGLATSVALIVGGSWTWIHFGRERKDQPRLSIEHKVLHWKISAKENLLSVEEILSNTGPVLLSIREGRIRVIQSVPVPKQLSSNNSGSSRSLPSVEDPDMWPVLVELKQDWNEGDLVIEPGESELINSEFVIPAGVKVVAIASFISNPSDKTGNLNWHNLTFYDVAKSGGPSTKSYSKPHPNKN